VAVGARAAVVAAAAAVGAAKSQLACLLIGYTRTA
jgi:hypothetical protein